MPHIVLLGDSVFDNKSYVGGGNAVIDHMRRLIPHDWRATLLAVDGATSSEVDRQTGGLPADATHMIVSAGGNDALGYASVLEAPSRSVADTLGLLAGIAQRFRTDYVTMLRGVVALGLPTAISTVYDPRYQDQSRRMLARTALCVINDAILREAAQGGLPVLDMRLICDEESDFANPIEPSVQGGAKISAAIIRLVRQHDFDRRRCEIFAR